jgi:hypothetical protein
MWNVMGRRETEKEPFGATTPGIKQKQREEEEEESRRQGRGEERVGRQ